MVNLRVDDILTDGFDFASSMRPREDRDNSSEHLRWTFRTFIYGTPIPPDNLLLDSVTEISGFLAACTDMRKVLTTTCGRGSQGINYKDMVKFNQYVIDYANERITEDAAELALLMEEVIESNENEEL